MSQHRFNTVAQGLAIQVLCGWDRPLQQYFLVIQALDDDWVEPGSSACEVDANGYLYTNLDDDHVPPVPSQLPYFAAHLRKLGIEVPRTLLVNLEQDRRENAGNKSVVYESNGQYRVTEG